MGWAFTAIGCGNERLTMTQAKRFPAAIRGPAAVDRQGVAVDEGTGLVVGKECDGECDVVGRSETSQRHAARDVGVSVATASLVCNVHFGFDPAGANRVDANAAAAPLGGERASEADQPVLGSVVGCAIGDAEQSGD